MDRGSTFSDPGIIKRLQTEFVPVVGNTHELQNGRSPARDWFMKMAASVNARVNNGNTAQGFYIAGPDGTAYGFNNNRTVERVNWFMDNSLKKLRESPPKATAIDPADLNAPFARTPGPSVSVMRVFARIRPLPEGCSDLNKGIARDHFWIYPSEVKEMYRLTEHGLNEPIPLPRSVVARLTRFHLVDNVR